MTKWFIVIDGKQIGPAFDTKEEALQWAKENLKKGA